MSIEKNNSSDSESDSDYEDVNNITKDRVKVYQVQFVKDEFYKFSCVGYFKIGELVSIEIANFQNEEYHCVITSNFVHSIPTDGTCLFDLITMNVIKSDGKYVKIYLSVEIDKPVIESENNKGNLMIWVEYSGRRMALKTSLTHPGNDRLPYYLIAELKNKRIDELLTETKEDDDENN